MGLRVTAAAAAIGVALFAASGASATTVITTYTGTVTDGGDSIFGADLTGDAFTAVFTADISIPGEENKSGTLDEVVGGASTPSLPSPSSAVITINGVSYFDSGFEDGTQEVTNFGIVSSANDGTLDADIGVQTGAHFALFKDLATPFTYAPVSGDDGFGLIDNAADATGRIDLDTTSVTVALAAPEPATWALMLLGVSGLGATLRTRRALRPARA
jgi:hypothetical protein